MQRWALRWDETKKEFVTARYPDEIDGPRDTWDNFWLAFAEACRRNESAWRPKNTLFSIRDTGGFLTGEGRLTLPKSIPDVSRQWPIVPCNKPAGVSELGKVNVHPISRLCVVGIGSRT
jgi:hypothetical protein